MLADLDSMLMATPLIIYDTSRRAFVPWWKTFVDIMGDRCMHKYGSVSTSLRDAEIDLELHTHGAWTDWENNLDPIWFPNPESLSQFVLTWA